MKVISGGQTGVDTAALEAAIKLGCSYGGWVPKGRLNENGVISSKYHGLRETSSADVGERTVLNVRDSDALLVLTDGNHSGGTQLAIQEAEKLRIPTCIIVMEEGAETDASQRIMEFLRDTNPNKVNIAGPRESEAPGIEIRAKSVLEKALVSI
ncbi:MAG: putative molybdenum carrier protein [Pseudomonadota bacterium]